MEYPRVLTFVITDDHWTLEKENDKYPSWTVAISTGLVFGGIHRAAWNFHFSTEVQRWQWRTSVFVHIYVPLLGIYSCWWVGRAVLTGLRVIRSG